mmetsp:Transcript_24709/g.34519  ORF Transcript_24709/g.34519 Transcript_24709/m.34519 type:complete len:144 (+) Transcript_24709:36-467(+)
MWYILTVYYDLVAHGATTQYVNSYARYYCSAFPKNMEYDEQAALLPLIDLIIFVYPSSILLLYSGSIFGHKLSLLFRQYRSFQFFIAWKWDMCLEKNFASFFIRYIVYASIVSLCDLPYFTLFVLSIPFVNSSLSGFFLYFSF